MMNSKKYTNQLTQNISSKCMPLDYILRQIDYKVDKKDCSETFSSKLDCLKQVTFNTIDINFIKSELSILEKVMKGGTVIVNGETFHELTQQEIDTICVL